MNREQTKAAIEIMKAYVDGAEIECSKNGSNRNWKNYWGDTPGWQWLDYEYRIKPALREGFVHLDNIHTGCHGRQDCIKVREVIE